MNNPVKEYMTQNGFQKFNNVAVDFIKEDIGVKVKCYENLGLYCLNYDQINSPKFHDVADWCRGIIVDTYFNIVCRPFKRFYNLGEDGKSKDIDISKFYVAEKLDGSLVKVYYYKDMWQIATRGTAFAETQLFTPLGPTKETFKEIILNEIGITNEQFQDFCKSYLQLDVNNTYLFEFASNVNRIVVNYENPVFAFLCSVNNTTGKTSLDFDIRNKICRHKNKTIRNANLYEFKGMDDLMNIVSNMQGVEQEGFVLYSKFDTEMIKIKLPSYLNLHLIRGEGLTMKRIYSLIYQGEVDEYVSYFEDDRSVIISVKKEIDTFCSKANLLFNKLKRKVGERNHKEMANAIKLSDMNEYFHLFMTAYRKNTKPSKILFDCNFNQFVKWAKMITNE